MYKNAGLAATTEEENLIPGSNVRPADVFIDNFPGSGNGLVIDITITDSTTVYPRDSLACRRRRAASAGICALERERYKRRARATPDGPTMQERLQNRGYKFQPIGMEADGAVGASWCKFIQKSVRSHTNA